MRHVQAVVLLHGAAQHLPRCTRAHVCAVGPSWRHCNARRWRWVLLLRRILVLRLVLLLQVLLRQVLLWWVHLRRVLLRRIFVLRRNLVRQILKDRWPDHGGWFGGGQLFQVDRRVPPNRRAWQRHR